MLNKILKFIKDKKFFLIGILLAILIIIIDQITKNYSVNIINEIMRKTNGVHTHIKKTSFFNIVLVYNRGISFGVFNDVDFMRNIIFCMISFISAFVMYLSWKSDKAIEIICFSFIFGGAIGNIIDRVLYGAVVDFLDFHLGQLHWPAFNVADSCVFIGTFGYLVADLFFTENKTENR